MTNRDRVLRFTSVLGCASALALVIAACSSSQEGFKEPPKPPPFEGADAEAPPPPETPVCGIHCSRDLKQVLDGCEGSETVVEQCNADQGCGNGKCVDPCVAAELNKGSAGCDFWTIPPEDVREAPGSCFAATIGNTWDRPITISAEYAGAPLDISKSTYLTEQKDGDTVYTLLDGPLPVGQVAVVFLAHDASSQNQLTQLCPRTVTPATVVDPLRHGTAKNKAFRLKTDAPVAAYSMYPYGGGVDSVVPTATLLLPVSSWENAYVAVSPHDFSSLNYNRTLQIVASEDDTEVQIRPTAEIPGGGGVSAATTGVPQTYRLGRGEVLQFSQVHALTGSPIVTNKPIGLFGGAVCSQLPVLYCDILQQQIPPMSQWGTEYAVVPYKPRVDSVSSDVREKVPYTIVAAADGTVLTYDPSRPRGAPETLNAGQSLSFYTDEIFSVRSQDSKHPFYTAVYMTASKYGNGTGRETLGDPDFVNIPASDQFLDRYVFFTDFTYPETTLTVVRKRTAKGFSPVELECAGELADWKPIGTEGKYEFTWVHLTNGFLPQKFAKGECGYGRQEAHSDGPFAITVWGMAVRASYGYVGGTGLRPINDAKPPVVQ